MAFWWTLPLFICVSCSSSNDELPDEKKVSIEVTQDNFVADSGGGEKTIVIKSTHPWNIKSDNQEWYTLSADRGYTGESAIKIKTQRNLDDKVRTGLLKFYVGNDCIKEFHFSQAKGVLVSYVPQGYSLVWNDEFNQEAAADGKPSLPSSEWWYEKGDGGWGNHEIQNYVAGFQGTDTCAIVKNGSLKIIAKKVQDKVLSVRMNTNKSWKYGYFEARLKLPKGKGTWPAFWMMPVNFNAWPDDGEIDIMEEVGYRPGYVSSSIHCKSYYHSIGTQKTGEQYIADCSDDFHIYALEWTESYIKGFVDGKCHFTFNNDNKGDKNTWPFNTLFYLKLNLAWGGDWGGAQGVDETALPTTYEIDYVRVYQKN